MVVNFVYNIAGLYVSKHGSAVLNSISFAALLPLTTLAFCFRPLLGKTIPKIKKRQISRFMYLCIYVSL